MGVKTKVSKSDHGEIVFPYLFKDNEHDIETIAYFSTPYKCVVLVGVNAGQQIEYNMAAPCINSERWTPLPPDVVIQLSNNQ